MDILCNYWPLFMVAFFVVFGIILTEQVISKIEKNMAHQRKIYDSLVELVKCNDEMFTASKQLAELDISMTKDFSEAFDRIEEVIRNGREKSESQE